MKYIVEIKPEYEDSFKGLMILGAKDSNLFVDVLAVDDLELLNSDYINDHFGSLQDTAYQKGFEDGKEASMGTLSKGCDGCKYVAKDSNEQPCKRCCNSHPCLWTKDGYAYDYIRNGIQNMIDTLHIGADEISKVLEEMTND